MEVYLIRHTTPAVAPGICYGQSDLDVTHTFAEEAQCIRRHLPETIQRVFSSPLRRCRMLAEYLFPHHAIQLDDRLKEINCGQWEMQPWTSICQQHLDAWMSDLVHATIPGGESYQQLYQRVVHFFQQLHTQEPIAIVTHGGVMRSMLAYLKQVHLHQSFDAFSIRYGCTIRVSLAADAPAFDYLHNPATVTETHRPQSTRRV